MKFSVVIATYNRAEELEKTLDSMSKLQVADPWEVFIVDNNSPDNTKEIVLKAAENFPVPLHYLFEHEQGRSAALNTGIRAAQGEIIVTTDDDVRVEADWLTNAERALNTLDCDYLGGKALPIGFQLLGPTFSESTLFRAAEMYQSATDWHTRRPTLTA